MAKFRVMGVGPAQVGQRTAAQGIGEMGACAAAVAGRDQEQARMDGDRTIQAGAGFTPPLLGVPPQAWIDRDIGVKEEWHLLKPKPLI